MADGVWQEQEETPGTALFAHVLFAISYLP